MWRRGVWWVRIDVANRSYRIRVSREVHDELVAALKAKYGHSNFTMRSLVHDGLRLLIEELKRDAPPNTTQ